jgi:hypothetical protein
MLTMIDVVDDLHGNIFDLVWVLVRRGLHPMNPFLFLGNSVDLGQ